MRKITILSVFALVLFVGSYAFDYKYKGVTFKCKVEGKAVCITGFDVKATDVAIPSVVSNKGVEYPVKSVSTFMNGVNYNTVTLLLEEGIEDIDKFCFNEFRKLQSVTLPSTINHIGKTAFRDNRGLAFNTPANIDKRTLIAGGEVWIDDAITDQGKQSDYAMADEKTQKNAEKQALKEQAALQKQLEDVQKQNERLIAEAKKKEKEQLAAGNADKSTDEGGKLFSLLGLKKKSGKKENTGQVLADYAPSPATAAVSSLPAAIPANPADAYKVPFADVDIDIPVTAEKKDDTYCIIIANEKYEDVPEVEYAARDGEFFKQYCVKTLGIPEKQIKSFINASYTDIKRALNWMETIADVTEGKSKIIFYYAGHGIPNEQDKTAYLIPTDGFPKDISTCFKLSDMYSRMANMNTQNITVFLDACFSGVKRGSGQALVAARGVAIKPREEVLSGNMVVFTAASDDETALAYQEKKHGMFTYFLLDKLKQSKGKVNFGDLFSTISSQVKKNSMLENDKLQTPSVNVSASMKNSWQNMHF